MASKKKSASVKLGAIKHDLNGLYRMIVTIAMGIGTYILLTQDGKTYRVTGVIIGLECANRLYNAHVNKLDSSN